MRDEDVAITDEVFRPLVKRKTPVVAVGLLRGGTEEVLTYGAQGARQVSADSVFEIGSITKTFTALLLAEMSSRGEVAVTDPLSRYVPQATAKRSDGREITLLDLATHTARLPGIPRSLWPEVLRNRSDPYARFTVARLEDALLGVRIKRKIGQKFRYSNFGFATLGHALSRAAGGSYESLVRDRICEPLRLTSTRFEPPPDTEQIYVQGHRRPGKPVPNWHLAAFAGAGALHSSVTDMFRYLRSHLHPEETGLREPLEDVQRPRLDISKGRLAIGVGRSAIGLGWLVTSTKSGTVVWHNGGTGGFSSFAGFHREADIGLVALANSAIYGLLTRTGLRALERVSASPMPQP